MYGLLIFIALILIIFWHKLPWVAIGVIVSVALKLISKTIEARNTSPQNSSSMSTQSPAISEGEHIPGDDTRNNNEDSRYIDSNELERLSTLKERGFLTEKEYETQKAKYISRKSTIERQEIAVAFSKKKIALLLLGASIFIIAGACISLSADNARDICLGIAGIVFFGICVIFCLMKYFDKKPGLIIRSDGFIDTAGNDIPWKNVSSIKREEL